MNNLNFDNVNQNNKLNFDYNLNSNNNLRGPQGSFPFGLSRPIDNYSSYIKLDLPVFTGE